MFMLSIFTLLIIVDASSLEATPMLLLEIDPSFNLSLEFSPIEIPYLHNY